MARILPALALLLPLAACAGALPIETKLGSGPPPPASFRLAASDNDQGAGTAVAAALTAAGWTAAPNGAYLVETSFTTRPQAAGAFVEGAALPKDDAAWLSAPHKKSWYRKARSLRTLSIRFVDPATGAEKARLEAATLGDADLADLARAVVPNR